MSTYIDKAQQDKTQPVTNTITQKKEDHSIFANNRPEAVAQRELQADINKSDRVQQFKAYQDLANNYSLKTASRFPPVQRKVNHTGLPDNLKTGIENLSNYSMDDVKVHYNSNKPGELQAHAYAQGTDIHVGPGQEQHLPHEAWHVVQQKQGRVKATMQMKGEMAVNDEPALESEADLMGSAALSLTQEPDVPLQLKSISGSPLTQFLFKEFKNDQDLWENAVVNARQAIENAVNMARDIALNWGDLANDLRPRIVQWYATAQEYFNNPALVTDFLYTRFGYAIETIACANLPGVLNGLNVDFQVAAGNTRPDIVLRNAFNQQIAWIDITSTASKNHIRAKDGAGWRTKPYVYEVFYETLDPGDVLRGMNNPVLAEAGGFMADMNKIATEEDDVQKQLLADTLINLQLENDWQTGFGSRTAKKALTQEALEELGMDLGPNNVQAAKGALKLVDINPGPFGHDGGSQSIVAARNWAREQATPEIDRRQAEEKETKIIELAESLEPYIDGSNTLAPEWFDSIGALTDDGVDWEADWNYDTDSIIAGIAIKHVLEKQEELDDDTSQFDPYAGNDLATAYVNRVTDAEQHFPAAYNFNDCRNYVDTAMRLIELQPIVMSTIETQSDFSEYLYRKYPHDNNGPTLQENQLMNALLNFPETLDAQEAGQNYLDENPLEDEEENGQMFFGDDDAGMHHFGNGEHMNVEEEGQYGYEDF